MKRLLGFIFIIILIMNSAGRAKSTSGSDGSNGIPLDTAIKETAGRMEVGRKVINITFHRVQSAIIGYFIIFCEYFKICYM